MDRPLSFMRLLDIHRDMTRAYRQHLAALIALNWEGSLSLLDDFGERLSCHAFLEETYILPVYAERAGSIPGGAPELFEAEHRRMNDFVIWLRDDIRAALEAVPQPGSARESALDRAIDILEREFRFKHLLEHHDMRERNVLYPTMDTVTTDAEKASLLSLAEG
ncbi:MAG: hypothetical protein IT210_07100 [Armatimonadetes bacterium]|nr:hypothetical protein [Armatimonadota bacterium]